LPERGKGIRFLAEGVGMKKEEEELRGKIGPGGRKKKIGPSSREEK